MTLVTKNKEKRVQPFNEERLVAFVDSVLYMKDFEAIPEESKEKFKSKLLRQIKRLDKIRAREITNKIINGASELISKEEPLWSFVASRFRLKELYSESAYNRSYDSSDKYGSLIGLLKYLGEKGVYSEEILKHYTKEELKIAESFIDPELDNLFSFIGIETLRGKYLARDFDGRTFELPQERYLIIALYLMYKEDKSKRLDLVKQAYWAISNQYMTVATPTWNNAGKATKQLSSCFIDLVEDSLNGIKQSNVDLSNVSKFGGGIGVYMGKVRSRGSSIRGYKNASGGVIPWIKDLNNMAISVDQLGQRQGALAVYLDVWHKDIFPFLDLKLNNGDERMRAHDIFTGVCLPDIFMEKVEKREDWYLFDPFEVKSKKGWSLEDFYDEKEGDGTFRQKYDELVGDNDISKTKVAAIDIMKRIMRSQLETGVPFMFYRDEVNRMNPNKHEGMIYSSNLCTEIMQNMSPSGDIKYTYEDGKVVMRKDAGDFVVCNLSSIHLGNTTKDGVLERLIPIQVRMLDNVIDINKSPVIQAEVTNQKYRAVGLGTFSYHQWLARNKMVWGSIGASEATDKLYEQIAYLTIKASHELAKEKGSYPLFEGSDWHTGDYFSVRGYDDEKWNELRDEVSKHGIRNGYLMAVAPNASTSVLTNGTATTDPIFDKFYYEEKKDFKIGVTVPELNPITNLFYDNAYNYNQLDSIKQASLRQKHIDQGNSFNLYVDKGIKASELLNIHMSAWKAKLKSTYYVRSTSVDLIECESCES